MTDQPAITPPVTARPTSSAATQTCDHVFDASDGRIAFTAGSGSAAGIATINADGSEFRLVVEPGDARTQPHLGTEGPRWAPGDRIVFSSNRAGGPDDWHLFIVDAAGGEPDQLTSGPDGIEYHGVMSADGSTLAYGKALTAESGPDPFRDAGIFISDANGRRQRPLTTLPQVAFDEWPDISPDGTQIAFGRVFDNTPGRARSSIFIVNADGSRLTQITDPELNAIRPRWSSDGKLVAFSSNADNFGVESANVWVIAPDGTDLRQVTHESGAGQAYFPDWSPDGEHIVALHHRARSSTVDLAVIGLDGANRCTLWQGSSALSAGDADWGEPGPRS